MRHRRRHRCLGGDWLGGIVADCGFTSGASAAALRATGIPFILGFARSRPVKELVPTSPPAALHLHWTCRTVYLAM